MIELDHKDFAWLLKVIKDSTTISGEDLGQAVETINKLQNLIIGEKKNGTKTN